MRTKNTLNNITFVITGYLINNNISSNSEKNKKAKELNIQIITEEEFIKLMEE